MNCLIKYIINLVHVTICKGYAGLAVKSHGQKIQEKKWRFYFVNKLVTHHKRETYADNSIGGSS